MPGEFGEGTSSRGDKSAEQEGEQGLYQPETLQNGGTGSSDPDQPDILSGSEGRALSDDFSLAEIDEGAGSDLGEDDYTDV